VVLGRPYVELALVEAVLHGPADVALEEAPDLDGPALCVPAQVGPQLPRPWATLSHGAFACQVVFSAFLVLQRVPTPLGL
jgi:hypothetical protein